MKKLMDAIKDKWGDHVGLVIYWDLSGHVFDENVGWNDIDYENCLFSFDDITKVTVEEIKNAPLVFVLE